MKYYIDYHCRALKNMKRDRERTVRNKKQYRYQNLCFPAYCGSPIVSNSFILIWIIAWFRRFFYIESRIIDQDIGKHWVL